MTKLKRSIFREYLVGGAGILIVVLACLSWVYSQTTTRDTPTPQNTLTGDGQMIHAGPFTLSVHLSPQIPQVGTNQIRIQVSDMQGQAVTGAQVRVVAERTTARSALPEYIPIEIRESSAGTYQGSFDLPTAGEWPLAIDVETDDSHHADLSFNMTTAQAGLALITQTPVSDVAYHTCSMHPSVKSALPGTCPICSMNLIAITRAELESGSITVEEGRRQMIGVKTGQVQKTRFSLPVHLYGEVRYDPAKIRDINLQFDGWIGTLNADYVGKHLSRGARLFSVYSPELLTLQEEHLEALRRSTGATQQNGQQTRIDASRKRLSLWGLSSEQIKHIEQHGKALDYVPILTQSDSVVLEKSIVNGSGFKRGQSLLRLADPSSVWIEAHAYEQQLTLLKAGMRARIHLPNSPDREFAAEVLQVDPFLQNQSRTARVRLLVDNSALALSPGQLAQITVNIDLGEVLLVPTDAVLVSGEKRIVFLDLGHGQLKPQRVRTGYSDGEYTVIRSGLRAGDHIVTSGNFLIAAESKLKAGVEQW